MDDTIEIYELHNYHFSMLMAGGYYSDMWVLSGNVYGRRPFYFDGEPIHVSTPQKLEGDILTTYSGSHYRLVNAYGNEGDIKAEINEVIKRGKYSRY